MMLKQRWTENGLGRRLVRRSLLLLSSRFLLRAMRYEQHVEEQVGVDGFTLIELLIGLLFGGILAMVLFSSFFQLTVVNKLGTNLIDTDTKLAIFHHQLERDLAGMFVPQAAIPEYEEEEKGSSEKKTEQKTAKSPAPAAEKKKKKIIEKPFFVSTKEGRLDMLTFITDNPLRIYQRQEQTTEAVPKTPGTSRTRRVTYQLIPDANNPQAFALTRRESTNLDIASNAYKATRAYELINNIQTLQLSFLRPIEPVSAKATSGKDLAKTEQNKKTQKQEKSPVDYATFTTWPPEQGAIELPHIVICTITLLSADREQTRSATFYMPYLAIQQLYPQEQEEKEKKQEEEVTPPPTAGTPGRTTPTPPQTTPTPSNTRPPLAPRSSPSSVAPAPIPPRSQLEAMMNTINARRKM
jgi:Tfp pilus assembly protein PilE